MHASIAPKIAIFLFLLLPQLTLEQARDAGNDQNCYLQKIGWADELKKKISSSTISL